MSLVSPSSSCYDASCGSWADKPHHTFTAATLNRDTRHDLFLVNTNNPMVEWQCCLCGVCWLKFLCGSRCTQCMCIMWQIWHNKQCTNMIVFLFMLLTKEQANAVVKLTDWFCCFVEQRDKQNIGLWWLTAMIDTTVISWCH